MKRLLLLFIDGIGLGESNADINPLAAARTPVLDALLEGRRLIAAHAGSSARRASLVGLDATLGVNGLPQSGTGQTALFTGENAPAIFGRHFGPWVPTSLRPLLAEHNVLTRVRAREGRVAFANAYPEEVFSDARRGRDPLRAGPPIAALGAGVMNRHTPELLRGAAVASEIVNNGWRQHLKRTELPVITAHEAGRNLAHIAEQHDLTLFAHYTTDHVGHTREFASAVAAVERVDEFLGGILTADNDLEIILASDHGNLEDVRAGHTINPAVGLFVGKHHRELAARATSLVDVAPLLLELAQAE